MLNGEVALVTGGGRAMAASPSAALTGQSLVVSHGWHMQ